MLMEGDAKLVKEKEAVKIEMQFMADVQFRYVKLAKENGLKKKF